MNERLLLIAALPSLMAACIEAPPRPVMPNITESPSTLPASPTLTSTATNALTPTQGTGATPTPVQPTGMATDSPSPMPAETPTPEVDQDGDGYTFSQGDCEIANANVYPGAPDVVGDGVDSNCNRAEDLVVTMVGAQLRDGGKALNSRMDNPVALAVVDSGLVYILDPVLNRLRVYESEGDEPTLETRVGDGTCDSSTGQGAYSLNKLCHPSDLLLDEESSELIISDSGHGRILALNLSSSTVKLMAGAEQNSSGFVGGEGINDGSFRYPTVLFMDTGANDIYVLDSCESESESDCGPTLWRWHNYGSNPTIEKVIGGGSCLSGQMGSNSLCGVRGGAIWDGLPLLSMVHDGQAMLVKVESGALSTVAGGPQACADPLGGSEHSLASQELCEPSGLVAQGEHFLMADAGGGLMTWTDEAVLWQLSSSTGSVPEEDSLHASEVALSAPNSVVGRNIIDGELWIGERGAHGLFRYDQDLQTVERVAGNGPEGFKAGDLDVAVMHSPIGVTAVAEGAAAQSYIADRGNGVLWSMYDGELHVVAGQAGVHGFSEGAESALEDSFSDLRAVAMAESGTVYILDGDRVRKLENAQLTTLAGGESGYDEGVSLAVDARFRNASDIFVSADQESLYIADTGNHRIRRITLGSGTIETVLGNGSNIPISVGGVSGDSSIASPISIYEFNDGRLYISESTSQRIVSLANGEVRLEWQADGGAEPADLLVMEGGMIIVSDTKQPVVRQILNGESHIIIGEKDESGYDRDSGSSIGTLLGGEGVSLGSAGPGAIWISDPGAGVVRLLTL